MRRACMQFLDAASEFYQVPNCGIRALAERPLRVRERGTFELFGDYAPKTMTAVRKEITSFCTEQNPGITPEVPDFH